MIREWRKHRGLTLERLAAQAETTAATLSRVETGKQPYSQPLLEALARVLQVEPSELVRSRPPSKEQVELIATIVDMPPDRQRQALRVLRAVAEGV